MSNRTPRPRALRRAIGLASAGVLVAGMAAVTTAADAARSHTSSRSSVQPGQDATPGRYIVLLRGPAATSYRGGQGAFARTAPAAGERFNARTAAVRQYTEHLRSQQSTVARSAGVQPAARYTIATNGFAAQLSTKQVMALRADKRVLLVSKDVARPLTNTADSLGMTGANGAWAQHGGKDNAGAGVVIADLDTGIWPESKSFSGPRLTGKPKGKWDVETDGHTSEGIVTRMDKADGGVFTGLCQLSSSAGPADEWTRSDCNRKLISARYYPDSYLADPDAPYSDGDAREYISTRDGNGHGSHTASTAAGNSVRATTEGVHFGEISGMAPAAKIAAYKVCFSDFNEDTGDCYTSSSLSAIDDAVSDGADVLNFSIGGSSDTVVDPVELAFEGAAEAGMFITNSAGNDGPTASTVEHPSPWLNTTAASTYTNFENTVVLGNGKKYVGASINNVPLPEHALVNSTDTPSGTATGDDATLCAPNSLDDSAVAGKIVVCTRGVYDRVAKSAEVARAGGVGMILANPSDNSLDADFHSVPTVHVQVDDGNAIKDYIASATSPTARFEVGNITKHTTPVPQIAGFSSRGPSLSADADILKPDISAPGVSVLAAVAPPTNSGRNYDLYSGTSMASPHIAGLAAFVLGAHPGWTAQQVRSAMMTTAKPLRTADGKRETDANAQGAGLVQPKKFFNPGWFVTSDFRQWRGFLLTQGYDAREGFEDNAVKPVAGKDVNLPSMAAGQLAGTTKFTRTFTSTMPGTWRISAHVPGFTVDVSRHKLVSERKGDNEKLHIRVTRTTAPLTEFAFGHLTLTGPTKLRLPIAVRPVAVKAPAVVSGTGTDGSVPVPITAGFTGDLQVNETGLALGDSADESVATGDYNLECFNVGNDSKLARFDIFSDDNDADLDMYVYKADACDPSTITALVGQSATASGDESVKVFDPEPGAYFVEVDGFAAGSSGDPIGYHRDYYDVNPTTATLGNFHADPNPVPVTQGRQTTFDAVWSGLAPNAHYLGLLEYDGALAPTQVEVDTTP